MIDTDEGGELGRLKVQIALGERRERELERENERMENVSKALASSHAELREQLAAATKRAEEADRHAKRAEAVAHQLEADRDSLRARLNAKVPASEWEELQSAISAYQARLAEAEQQRDHYRTCAYDTAAALEEEKRERAASQAREGAMREALEKAKEFMEYEYDAESHWHECEQKPDDALDPPDENCNCQVGVIARVRAALAPESQSAAPGCGDCAGPWPRSGCMCNACEARRRSIARAATVAPSVSPAEERRQEGPVADNRCPACARLPSGEVIRCVRADGHSTDHYHPTEEASWCWRGNPGDLAQIGPAPTPAEERREAPTHRCKVCGALWRLDVLSWVRLSGECSAGCGGLPMRERLVPLPPSEEKRDGGGR